MTSWRDVTELEPALAARVRETFAERKHAVMATLRQDGSPRISGTEVDFAADGEIYVAMMPGTRRAADLRRDPRVAVHCPTVDPPADDAEAWLGESKLDAQAVEVEPDRFRLDVERVVLTRVADGALLITTWSAASGLVELRRS